MTSLLYELVPGVDPDELADGTTVPLDAAYQPDVDLPWTTGGTGPSGLGGPGWHENARGGPSTVGGLGPWPVPAAARVLTFWLKGPGGIGSVEVDISARTATWVLLDS